MHSRKGFTLIELLIVVTILAILSGAAIPYVQDYVEDARIAKAKDDLGAIKSAITLYETRRGEVYGSGTMKLLCDRGYMTQQINDPWGAPYIVSTGTGEVITYGADGNPGGGDDIKGAYQPPQAVTRVYWIDYNNDGSVTSGDVLNIYFTRPVSNLKSGAFTAAGGSFDLMNGGVVTTFLGTPGAIPGQPKVASYTINAMATAFTPGKSGLRPRTGVDAPTDFGTPAGPATVDTITILPKL